MGSKEDAAKVRATLSRGKNITKRFDQNGATGTWRNTTPQESGEADVTSTAPVRGADVTTPVDNTLQNVTNDVTNPDPEPWWAD
jgi:hypothetical protein